MSNLCPCLSPASSSTSTPDLSTTSWKSFRLKATCKAAAARSRSSWILSWPTWEAGREQGGGWRVEHLAGDPVKLEKSQTGVPKAQGDDGYDHVDFR